jgi:hypothetical protein
MHCVSTFAIDISPLRGYFSKAKCYKICIHLLYKNFYSPFPRGQVYLSCFWPVLNPEMVNDYSTYNHEQITPKGCYDYSQRITTDEQPRRGEIIDVITAINFVFATVDKKSKPCSELVELTNFLCHPFGV